MNFNCAHYMAHPNIGDTHQILNTSMILMLGEIYDKVIVYAPKDCCLDLEKQVCNQNACLSTQITYKFNKIYSQRQFLFWITCGFQTLSSMCKTKRGEDIYFSTLNWLCFPLFNLWSRLSKRRMFTLCHNDMEHLINPKTGRVNVHWHMINYIFKRLSLAKSNMFIVLGDCIAENLKKVVKQDTINNIISICHPYYNLTELKEVSVTDKIKIGIVGTVKHNDMQNLKKINAILSDYSKIKLYNISTTSEDISIFENVVNLNSENKHMNRMEYDSCIKEMDLLYYPYPRTSYRVSASGAVFEAIVKCKPIIAEANPYVEWIFDKFGDLGYLYNDKIDLKKCIDGIVSQQQSLLIKENLEHAKRYLDPKHLYMELKRIIDY